MSNWAMGWAQRQRLGDPVAKSVLYTMCYVMRDDTLLVYVGIPTLEESTEFEERAIRKGILRLVETGVLLDTGMRRNNVPVYRIPGYEAWLAAQQTSTPQDGRALSVDAVALAQVADLTAQKRVGKGGSNKHPPKGEGSPQAPPSSLASPPELVPQALPKAGPNLGSDQKNLNPSAGARAIPTGSRPAKTPEDIEREEAATRQLRAAYGSQVMNALLALAPYYDAARTDTGKRIPTCWGDLVPNARRDMPAVVQRLIARCVDMATDIPPKSASVIDNTVNDELVLELKQFKQPTRAECAA